MKRHLIGKEKKFFILLLSSFGMDGTRALESCSWIGKKSWKSSESSRNYKTFNRIAYE
jgi:hypothetical protein